MTACFTGTVRVSQRHIEVAVGVALVAERAAGQARHAADMARRERDLEAVRRGVGKSVDAVGPEVVVLALLAVGDDRRAGGLELRDRVADGRVVQRVQGRILRSAAIASISDSGRGMLPIGSVGMFVMDRNLAAHSAFGQL